MFIRRQHSENMEEQFWANKRKFFMSETMTAKWKWSFLFEGNCVHRKATQIVFRQYVCWPGGKSESFLLQDENCQSRRTRSSFLFFLICEYTKPMGTNYKILSGITQGVSALRGLHPILQTFDTRTNLEIDKNCTLFCFRITVQASRLDDENV